MICRLMVMAFVQSRDKREIHTTSKTFDGHGVYCEVYGLITNWDDQQTI